jgi:sigma-B regulation protein RsbU (phosphoserine phosphatase)
MVKSSKEKAILLGLLERTSEGRLALRSPISFKITLPYILLALIFALLATVIVSQLIFDNLENRFRDQLVTAAEISRDLLVDKENELLASLRSVSFTQGVSELISNADAEGLREILLPIVINQNIDVIEVLDLNGVSLISLRHIANGGIEDYESQRADEIFADWDFVQKVMRQSVDINNEELSNKFAGWVNPPWGSTFYVSGPIYSELGNFAGMVLVGERIETIGEDLRREVGAEAISFYDQDGLLAYSTYSLIQQEILTEGLTKPEADFNVIRPLDVGSLAFSEITGEWTARNGEQLGFLGISRAQSQTISAGESSRIYILFGFFLFFALVIGVGLYISRLITQPLKTVVSGIQKIEKGNLDVFLDVESKDEFEILSKAFNEMVGGLQTKERMATELNFAKEIQLQMMPNKSLKSSIERGFVVRAHLEAAREVGGDFYDFFYIDEDKSCFVIGDVSGKGAPGAMLMAVAKTLIKSLAASGLSTGEIMSSLNNELSQNNDAAMFVTIFLGIIHHPQQTFTYTNAGHNPPLLKKNSGEVVKLDQKHGPMVGPFKNIKFKEGSLNLEPGDSLLLFTDGVSEAMDVDAKLYTEEKIADLITRTRVRSLENLVDKLVNSVSKFVGEAEQADDITLLALRIINSNKVKSKAGELSIRFGNNKVGQSQTAELISNFLETNRINDKLKHKVLVAFDEMAGNTISYGYSDERNDEIELKLNLDNTSLEMVIVDQGDPFNPLKKANPEKAGNVEEAKVGGLGIHMTKELVDELSYDAVDGKNVLTMLFVRS